MGKSLLNWLFAIIIFSISIFLMIFIGLNWSTSVEISLVFGEPVSIPVIYLLLLSFFAGGCVVCLCLFSSHRLQHTLRRYQEEEREERRKKKNDKREERKINK